MRNAINERKSLFVIALTVILLGSAFNIGAQSFPDLSTFGTIKSSSIRTGTLEITSKRDKSFIFRCNGIDESFDFTGDGVVNAMFRVTPLLSLEEIGFRTTRGNEYFYGKQSKLEFSLQFEKDNPGIAVSASVLIFKTVTNQRLELRPSGRTKVFRVDLKTDNGTFILWANTPSVGENVRPDKIQGGKNE